MHSPLFILSNDLYKPLDLFNIHSDALRSALVRIHFFYFPVNHLAEIHARTLPVTRASDRRSANVIGVALLRGV
jgi:hypothetical protein